MTKHPHLPRNINRRLPPRQQGPDPARAHTPPVPPLAVPRHDSAELGAVQPTASSVDRADDLAGGDLLGLLRDNAYDDPSRALVLSEHAAAQAARVAQATTVTPSTTGGATRPPRRAAAKEPGLDPHALGRSSVATEAQATYERVGDARSSEPAVARRPNARPGQFNTPILKELQILMQEIGGAGASLADQTKLFKFFEKYDQSIIAACNATANASAGAGESMGGASNASAPETTGVAAANASVTPSGSSADASEAMGRSTAAASSAGGVQSAKASATAGGASAEASAVAAGSTATASTTGGGPSAKASATAGGSSADASAVAGGSTATASTTGGSPSSHATVTASGRSADASAVAGVSAAAASTMGGGPCARASATAGGSADASAVAGGSTAAASTTGVGATAAASTMGGVQSAKASATAGGTLADASAAADEPLDAASPPGGGSSSNASGTAGGSSDGTSPAPRGGHTTTDAGNARGSLFISGVFRTANALRTALRDDLDDAVLKAGWRKCTLSQGGVKYVTFFRSAMGVAMRVLREAGKVQLRRDAAEVGDRREHPIDGEAFQAHQDSIDTISDGKGFVLGIYVYSDATLLSWSGGTLILLLSSRPGTTCVCHLGLSLLLCLSVFVSIMQA